MVNGQLVGNPMTLPSGSCSAVISARCHTTGRERGLWARNVKWGTVREGVGMEVSHGGFSAGQVSLVDVARSYA
jgi:predicted CxxxxCH...CXXCH cytochrome family protein